MRSIGSITVACGGMAVEPFRIQDPNIHWEYDGQEKLRHSISCVTVLLDASLRS